MRVVLIRPTVGSRVRAIVERLLPWYDPRVERWRDLRTEAIRLRAIRERQNVERVIARYHEADQQSRRK